VNELALFAGAGGGILGGLACGFRTVCAVEIDEYARRILLARQRDGCLPRFPIWDDVRTFDGIPWRGHIDVITGGFPCQDISSAGKRAGIAGARSGLWADFARIIGEVRPRYALIENSQHLRTRGLDVVLRDLAEIRYDAEWMVLGAADVGAPHQRDRLWILAADADRDIVWLQPRRECGACGAEAAEHRHDRQVAWPLRASNPRVDDGLAHRVDRTRATGNGQVARVAAMAWAELLRRHGGQ
jgi:DNA (cytosine-5)-methyltransferase 1